MNDPDKHELPDTPTPRRIAPWSKLGGGALTFAIVLHVIVLTLAGIWIYTIYPPSKPPPIIVNGEPRGGDDRTTAPTLTPATQPQQIIPSGEIARIIAQGATTPVSIPDSGEKLTHQSALVDGALTGTGGSRGPGDQPGNSIFSTAGDPRIPFRMIDETIGSKRCSKADRLQRIKDNGGTPACEQAVLMGLRWLKANQAADGSWGGHKAAMTGLALLAYFGHCETPASAEFGDSCALGITYLVNLGMKNNGRLATNPGENSWPYEHAIATYALAEAVTFCKGIRYEVLNLTETTTQAGQFIIDNQHEKGGWAYLYAKTTGRPDVSVSGWQIQALKACSHTGIPFRGLAPCIKKALGYVSSCQNESGGFGYSGPGDGERNGYFTLTGVGMLCNQMWDQGSSQVRKGAKYVLKNSQFDYNGECCDLYGHYYESQAMMQRGGADWKKYNDLFRDQLLNNQDTDGSWKVPGGGKNIRAAAAEFVNDKVYRTCLCTLMLEVYYRFLSTGGGNAKDHADL